MVYLEMHLPHPYNIIITMIQLTRFQFPNSALIHHAIDESIWHHDSVDYNYSVNIPDVSINNFAMPSLVYDILHILAPHAHNQVNLMPLYYKPHSKEFHIDDSDDDQTPLMT